MLSRGLKGPPPLGSLAALRHTKGKYSDLCLSTEEQSTEGCGALTMVTQLGSDSLGDLEACPQVLNSMVHLRGEGMVLAQEKLTD